MKFKVNTIVEVVEHLELSVTEEWSCAECGEFTEYSFSFPKDYGENFPCSHCEYEYGLIIEPEFIAQAYGDLLKEKGYRINEYEIERI